MDKVDGNQVAGKPGCWSGFSCNGLEKGEFQVS